MTFLACLHLRYLLPSALLLGLGCGHLGIRLDEEKDASAVSDYDSGKEDKKPSEPEPVSPSEPEEEPETPQPEPEPEVPPEAGAGSTDASIEQPPQGRDGGPERDASAGDTDAGTDDASVRPPKGDGGRPSGERDGGVVRDGGNIGPVPDAAPEPGPVRRECGPNCVCESGEHCELVCLDAYCFPTCKPGSDCQIYLAPEHNGDVQCADDAECRIWPSPDATTVAFSCTGSGECRTYCGTTERCAVDCSLDAKCVMECQGTASCSLECDDPARCWLHLNDSIDPEMQDLVCEPNVPKLCSPQLYTCAETCP